MKMVLNHIRVRLVMQTHYCPTCYANKIDIKLCKHVHEWFRIIPRVTRVWWHLVLLHFPETHGKCQFFPVALLPISSKVKIGCYSENKLISSRKNTSGNDQSCSCWKFIYPSSYNVKNIDRLNISQVPGCVSALTNGKKNHFTSSKYRLKVAIIDLLKKIKTNKWNNCLIHTSFVIHHFSIYFPCQPQLSLPPLLLLTTSASLLPSTPAVYPSSVFIQMW